MYQGAEQDWAMMPELELPRAACAVAAPLNYFVALIDGTRFEWPPPGVHRPARQVRVTAESAMPTHLRLPLWQ
jgi:hypothetical protein